MNIFLLDTNIISEPTKIQPSETVINKIAENIEYSCICSMVWAEVLSGIKILPEGKRKSELLNFFIESVQKMYEIVPFDTSCASIYSDILQRLKENSTPVPKLDMLIAATAIANNLILVTRNTADFEPIAKVSNLTMENWF